VGLAPTLTEPFKSVRQAKGCRHTSDVHRREIRLS
jgi:hypothetical protein